MRAAARPPLRLLVAVLHALCVAAGPGLHLWQAGACGCGHEHAVPSARAHAECSHGHGCSHGHSHEASVPGSDDSDRPSPTPTHDPDDCPVCQELALARIAAPAVRLTLVSAAVPFVGRPLSPPRPIRVAADALCRGPPRPFADV